MAASKNYGRDFARVYAEHWAVWGERMWPFLLKLVAKERPGAESWLDLCCGTGQLLQRVTERGFAAVGVDKSRFQIERARRIAPKARYHVHDVTRLKLGKTFDVVTCTYDSLNYLTRKRELAAAFGRAAEHLDEDGIFIFDINTRRGLEDHWNQTFTIEAPGLFVTVEAVYDKGRVLGTCRITGFLREGRKRVYRRFDEIHVERGYIPGEIEALLERSGLVVEREFDGENFGRPRGQSGRLIYVCRHGV